MGGRVCTLSFCSRYVFLGAVDGDGGGFGGVVRRSSRRGEGTWRIAPARMEPFPLCVLARATVRISGELMFGRTGRQLLRRDLPLWLKVGAGPHCTDRLAPAVSL
jgi:hypothetical protein